MYRGPSAPTGNPSKQPCGALRAKCNSDLSSDTLRTECPTLACSVIQTESMVKHIRDIDSGGFGRVDEVELGHGTRVARKTFHPQFGTDEEKEKLRKRFEREVRIQSQISHPNIMPILDSDLSADPPWFTMPLASKSYETQIAEDRHSGNMDVEPWNDILAGVEELHRLGYVHRDLKPQNVLFVADRWVVSDFGLILPTMRDTTVLTGTRSAYGSRSYAAPEQARDFRHTPEQADIFALGCILHDIVDRYPARVPFAQATTTGPYAAIIEKATELDPARRFPTIAALRSALFDIWRTASFPPPQGSVADRIENLLANLDALPVWEDYIRYLEDPATPQTDRSQALEAINADMIERLHQIDPIWFGRLVESICGWAAGSGFAWDYCDVVGDRLVRAYRLGGTRVKCSIVEATLELAVSHNRWKVMGQAGRMLDADAEPGLVDRMLIELRTSSVLRQKCYRIETIILWRRGAWHPRIAAALSEFEST